MEGGGTSVWTGMTIRDILEKVDLININEPTGNPAKNQKSSMMMDHESSPERKTLFPCRTPRQPTSVKKPHIFVTCFEDFIF